MCFSPKIFGQILPKWQFWWILKFKVASNCVCSHFTCRGGLKATMVTCEQTQQEDQDCIIIHNGCVVCTVAWTLQSLGKRKRAKILRLQKNYVRKINIIILEHLNWCQNIIWRPNSMHERNDYYSSCHNTEKNHIIGFSTEDRVTDPSWKMNTCN